MNPPSAAPSVPGPVPRPARVGAATRDVAVEAVRAVARAARLLERASGELGMAQYRVLSAVAAGDAQASRVARRFGLGRPTVSAAVDALCRDGLLERAAAADHRAIALSVTPAGQEVLQAAETAMAVALDDLCARTPSGRPLLAALASLGPAVDARLTEREARTGRPRR